MPSFVVHRFQPYPGYCWKCFHGPQLVGVERPYGLEFTGLCGWCFFKDPEMRDPETWNEESDDEKRQG